MSIQLLDKPLEEMNIDELRRERRIHVFLANTYERILIALFARFEFREPLKVYPTEEDITEKYILGIYTEEEYQKQLRAVRMYVPRQQAYQQARQDKLDYLSMVTFEERAVIAMIEDRIEELGYKRPKKKGKKGKRKYTPRGYDPRKWISKHNYIRPKYSEYKDLDKLRDTDGDI